jgi:hypothetical protein
VVNLDLGALPVTQWLSTLDASGLLMSAPAATVQGTAVSGAISALRQRPVAPQLGGIGTEPCIVGYAVPRPQVESVSFLAAAYGSASAGGWLGRAATNHNSTVKQYATSVNVGGGVATSGPPRRQTPA